MLSPPPAPRSVRYACPELDLSKPDTCEPPPPWVEPLARFGDLVLEPANRDFTATQCNAAGNHIERALAYSGELSQPSRWYVQNIMLRVFAGHALCLAHTPTLGKQAARAVSKFADPAHSFETIDLDVAEQLAPILGPSSNWWDMHIPRSRRGPTSFHERAAQHTRMFRPLRSGTTRAIVSQVVVLDDSWRPHVVPLVASIELRDGLKTSAPACALALDPASLGCLPQLSPVEDLQALVPNRFLFATEPGHVGCNQCHTPEDAAANLHLLSTKQRAVEVLTDRRELLYQQLMPLVDRVRQAAME